MVKNIVVFLFSLIFFAYSCTFYRNAYDYSSSEEFHKSINRQAKEREAIIKLNNDSLYKGTMFHITSDSSYWTDSETGHFITQSNPDINEIMFEHPARGMLNGMLFGAASSLLISVPIINSLNKNTNKEAGGVEILFILSGIFMVGIIAGGIIGHNISDKHVYIINPEIQE